MKTREQKVRLMLSLAIAVAFSGPGLLATNAQVPVVDDRTIVSDIRHKLSQDPSLRHIHVGCQDGVVTLSGTVNTPTEESTAVRIASEEPGVRNVVSQLGIKHATEHATEPATPPKKAQDVASQEKTKATKTTKTHKTKSTDSTKTSETPKP